MNLGETVICCDLEGAFYVGASLCRLCVPSVFGARVEFDVDASHIFPQSVLATITLIGSVVDVGAAKDCTGVRQNFPSAP